MSEDQAGTPLAAAAQAALVPAYAGTAPADSSTPAPASDSAQPQAQAPTTPATPTTPVQNWDTPENPYLRYRDQFAGQQGAVKAITAERNQLQARLAQIEAERETAAARATQEAENRRLDALLEQDDGPVAQELRAKRQQQKAVEEWQRENFPAFRQQLERQVYGQYEGGLRAAVQGDYLTPDELGEIARRETDYTSYHKSVIRAAVEKAVTRGGGQEAAIQRRIDEAVKATEARVRAEMRGSESSPDVSAGGVAPNSDNDFLAEFASRDTKRHSIEDYKRAKALLGI